MSSQPGRDSLTEEAAHRRDFSLRTLACGASVAPLQLRRFRHNCDDKTHSMVYEASASSSDEAWRKLPSEHPHNMAVPLAQHSRPGARVELSFAPGFTQRTCTDPFTPDTPQEQPYRAGMGPPSTPPPSLAREGQNKKSRR